MESPNPNTTPEESISNNTNAPIQNESPKPTTNNSNHKTKLVLAALISSLILIIIIGVYVRTFLSSEVRITSEVDEPISSQDVNKLDSITEVKDTSSTSAPSIKLTNIQLHSPVEDRTEKIFVVMKDDIDYDDPTHENYIFGKIYSIGKSDNWNLFFIETEDIGPGYMYPSIYYISNGNEKYYTVDGNLSDSEWFLTEFRKNLLPDVKEVSSIQGLPVFPSKLAVNGGDYDLPTDIQYITDNRLNIDGREVIKFADYSDSDFDAIYSIQKGISSKGDYIKSKSDYGNDDLYRNIYGVYSRSVFLRHPTIKLGKFYAPSYNFISDDQRVIANWNDGRSNDIVYSANTSGCGGYASGLNVIKSSVIPDSALTVVGKTSFGDTLYQLKNPEETIVQYMYYSKYFPFRDPENGPYTPSEGGTSTEVLSYEDFVKAPNHFLYKDSLGDYILFTNQEFAELAECGKPVVYLYPEKETQVSVNVDARIRISDPEYGNGWEVTAFPNGELVWNGQKYDYLYWDGLGNGIYPNTKETGIVVETSEAENTIRSQLQQMNLNEKEIEDFVEFWIPLMPKTPYVRITWIGTNDMNSLARMDINPKPDTLIRVFMDYEGLNREVKLNQQRFYKTPRKGFTVVEWGGLLRR